MGFIFLFFYFSYFYFLSMISRRFSFCFCFFCFAIYTFRFPINMHSYIVFSVIYTVCTYLPNLLENSNSNVCPAF
ncbi:hypothetical protein DFH27DRAFT_576822 [Peziza echinospora]|nr:hypothetical protein DFH27DRAFT_576822 [Peziza echinospora]